MSDELPPPLSVGDCIGTPAAVEHAGKTYTLGRPTPEVLAAIEQAIARDTWEAAQELREVAPGIVEDARQRLLTRQYAAGGPLWDQTLRSRHGTLLQLWALVRANHPEFTRQAAADLFAACPDRCELAVMLVAPDFYEAAALRAGDGAERAAAKRAAVGELKAKAVELAKGKSLL